MGDNDDLMAILQQAALPEPRLTRADFDRRVNVAISLLEPVAAMSVEMNGLTPTLAALTVGITALLTVAPPEARKKIGALLLKRIEAVEVQGEGAPEEATP